MLIVIIILLVTLIILGVYLNNKFTVVDLDKQLKIKSKYFKKNKYDPDKFEKKYPDMEYIEVLTSHNIPIYKIDNRSDKSIILVHFYNGDHTVMYPLAEEFLNKGWNVYLYDQRNHSDNDGNSVTYGFEESKDLKEVIKLVDSKYIGVLGQSMGASTVGYLIGDENKLNFAIMDSGFTSMKEIVKLNLKKKHLLFLYPVVKIANKIMNGFSIDSVNIEKKISDTKTPVLIIHSKKDTTVPYSMAERLYNSIKGDNKVLVNFDNCGHVRAYFTDHDKYMKEVFNFIDDNLN